MRLQKNFNEMRDAGKKLLKRLTNPKLLKALARVGFWVSVGAVFYVLLGVVLGEFYVNESGGVVVALFLATLFNYYIEVNDE